jgi:hypothetical protein
MRNSFFGLSLSALLFALCFSAHAQQPTKVPRVAFLGVRPDDSKTTFESFKRQLQTLGYTTEKTSSMSIATPRTNLNDSLRWWTS